jgi:multidrug efflux system membrane fusion protein
MMKRDVNTQAGRRNALAAALAGLCLLAVAAGCKKAVDKAAGAAKPPVPVRTAVVKQAAMPVEFRTFGAVAAYSTVEVKSQVGGVLVEECVQPGQAVEKGAVLFRIDRRPFEADLRRAEATRERDRVQAAEAERKAKIAEALFKSGVGPEEDFKDAQATVAALQAQVAVSAAQADQARLNLEYCEIKAPLTGHVGDILVRRGSVVKANDATITSLAQTRPVFAVFALPQTRLPELRAEMAAHPVAVTAALRGAATPADQGKIVFVDNEVDAASGTIRVKAEFPNDGEALWPGQYVDVTLAFRDEPDAITVPGSAVQNGQQGNYVFVVGKENTAELRPVTVARPAGDLAVIGGGLKPGERVVTDGQIRLVPGDKVKELEAQGK